MRRRAFLGAMGALVVAPPGLGAASVGPPGELFTPRRMKFEEIGDSVMVTVAVPELLPRGDGGAMESIESGFATTLRFEATVFPTRSDTPVGRRSRVVKIQWNPWRERYVVQTTDQGHAAAARFFDSRDAAIAHAVTLERMRVSRASALARGPQATYVVTLIAMRNPIDPQIHASASGAGQRAPDGDLSAFSRWIGMFVQSAPAAEKTVALRSSPAFYLVQR
ncbi:MAG: DUF4390 domain-containing protein [Nannocystaceae bacterium]